MGWLIFLAVIVILAVLPLGASARYGAEGPRVHVIAGPIRIKIFPLKKKAKSGDKAKQKKSKQPKKSPPEKKDKAEKPAESGGSWKDFLPLVQVLLDFLNDFRLKLRLNCIHLKIILAGDDPADLAISYGRAWAALGNLWPKLEEVFVIKQRDVEILCDYTAEQTMITARLDITITLGRIVSLLVRYGIRAFKVFLKIRKEQKGGNQK